MMCPHCHEPIDRIRHAYTQDIIEAITIVDRIEGPEPPRGVGDDEETLAIVAALPRQRRTITLEYGDQEDEAIYRESYRCPTCDRDLDIDADWHEILIKIGYTVEAHLDAFTYDGEDGEDK